MMQRSEIAESGALSSNTCAPHERMAQALCLVAHLLKSAYAHITMSLLVGPSQSKRERKGSFRMSDKSSVRTPSMTLNVGVGLAA